MFVGFILRVSPGQVMQSMVSFKNTILLNVLLARHAIRRLL